jgi:hypothetical protein
MRGAMWKRSAAGRKAPGRHELAVGAAAGAAAPRSAAPRLRADRADALREELEAVLVERLLRRVTHCISPWRRRRCWSASNQACTRLRPASFAA